METDMITPTVSSPQTPTMHPTKAYDGLGAGKYLIAVIVMYSLGSFMALGWSMVCRGGVSDKENRQTKRIVTNLHLIKTEEDKWKAVLRKEEVKARLRELNIIRKAKNAASSVMEEMNLPDSITLSILMNETSAITSCENRNGASTCGGSFSAKLPVVDHGTNSSHTYINAGFLHERSNNVPVATDDIKQTVIEMNPQSELKGDRYVVENPLQYFEQWNSSDDRQSVISSESLLHEADIYDDCVINSTTPDSTQIVVEIRPQSPFNLCPSGAEFSDSRMAIGAETESHTIQTSKASSSSINKDFITYSDMVMPVASVQSYFVSVVNNSDDRQSLASSESLLHEDEIYDDCVVNSTTATDHTEVVIEIRPRSSIDQSTSGGEFCDARMPIGADSESLATQIPKTSCSSINTDFRPNSKMIMPVACVQSHIVSVPDSHSASNGLNIIS